MQILVGESTALASLASELLILDVAQIPRNEQFEFTGRGQYPSFKIKPLIKGNDLKFNTCNFLVFWGKVKGISAHILNELKGTSDKDLFLSRTSHIKAALRDCENFLDDVDEEKRFKEILAVPPAASNG